MSPSPTSPGAAPLPPLPDLSAAGQAAPGGNQNDMATLMSGVAPIKSAVDAILAACRQVVQSGILPGVEQSAGQVMAIATSWLPMAAQQVLQPGGGSGGPVPPIGAPPAGA